MNLMVKNWIENRKYKKSSRISDSKGHGMSRAYILQYLMILSADQKADLRALKQFGYNYIAKDKNYSIHFFECNPELTKYGYYTGEGNITRDSNIAKLCWLRAADWLGTKRKVEIDYVLSESEKFLVDDPV